MIIVFYLIPIMTIKCKQMIMIMLAFYYREVTNKKLLKIFLIILYKQVFIRLYFDPLFYESSLLVLHIKTIIIVKMAY